LVGNSITTRYSVHVAEAIPSGWPPFPVYDIRISGKEIILS
jgi:hypothetical protein